MKTNERQIMAQISKIQDSPKKVKEKPRRTISNILWGKFLDRIEISGATLVFSAILKFFLFVGVVSWLISPETVASFALKIFEWRNYLLSKILASGVFIFHIEIFIKVFWHTSIIFGKILKKIFLVSAKMPKFKNSIECINGIPHNELITHLLEVGSFKRMDIEKKFSIPRRQYETLAKSLETLGILQKDKTQNNAFAFIQEFTRQDLANVFEGKNNAKDLVNFAKKIEKTLLLSPTPNFTRKKII